MFRIFVPMFLNVYVLGTNIMPVNSLPMEPVCSKFDYEYKTLEAMLRVERHVEDMKKEMERLKDDVEKKLQEMEHLKQDQEKGLATMKQSLEEKSVTVPESRDNANVPSIAFSVGNPTLADNDGVLLFKTVTTNVGEAYDAQTGKFTCPMDGIYMFVLAIATNRGSTESWCKLQLNNKMVTISRSYYTMYTTASNTVILELRKDDVVAPGDCYKMKDMYTSHSATSFSGVLITKS